MYKEIWIFLVYTTLFFIFVETQGLDGDYDGDNEHFYITDRWYVLNATWRENVYLHEPKCWSLIMYTPIPNQYKGFSFYLTNDTNEQVSVHLDATEVPGESGGKFLFKITSPKNSPQVQFSEFNVTMKALEEDAMVWSIEIMKDTLPIGSLRASQDVSLIDESDIWKSCGEIYTVFSSDDNYDTTETDKL